MKFLIFNNELENVTLKIDQKNLYNLELQRKNKLDGISDKVKKFSKPFFLQLDTYRFVEHCGPNNDDYLKYRDDKD